MENTWYPDTMGLKGCVAANKSQFRKGDSLFDCLFDFAKSIISEEIRYEAIYLHDARQ